MKTKLTPQERDAKRANAQQKKELAQANREVKRHKLIESTKKIQVNTFDGKRTLHYKVKLVPWRKD